MCLVYVLYCCSCDQLSPLSVLTAGENTRQNRPYYYLVYDVRCSKKWDCRRQSQVNQAYAPGPKERERFGEGPCILSASDTASGKPSGCNFAACGLVRVERNCLRQSAAVLAFKEETPPLVDPVTGEWRPSTRKWVVRKAGDL